MEKFSTARLIGAPPGYVGYDEGGQLTEAIRRKPYAVILFDEIEKAHPDVFHVLLQVLDDGRLTDSQGRTVDFKNTIIIMTSNIGSRFLLEGVQGDSIPDSVRESVMAELRKAFRPEFLNRVDETILFKPLTLEEITSIVDLLMTDLNKRLAERRVTVKLDPKAKEWVAEKGYDPAAGSFQLLPALRCNAMTASMNPKIVPDLTSAEAWDDYNVGKTDRGWERTSVARRQTLCLRTAAGHRNFHHARCDRAIHRLGGVGPRGISGARGQRGVEKHAR